MIVILNISQTQRWDPINIRSHMEFRVSIVWVVCGSLGVQNKVGRYSYKGRYRYRYSTLLHVGSLTPMISPLQLSYIHTPTTYQLTIEYKVDSTASRADTLPSTLD